MSVAFYISGHGFGHASRQIEIMNALGRRTGQASILVRTSAPRWLFERTMRVPYRWVDCECDTGVVQIDSLHLDEAETARRAKAFYATFGDRVAHEAALLAEQSIRLVISDAPPLGCAAAARAGIPSLVISNFTWDWIYSAYSEYFETEAPTVVAEIREAYRQATQGLRLPMAGGFDAIGRVEDIPFVARRARADLLREDVLTGLDVPTERPIALSSFSHYGVSGLDVSSLDCLEDWTVVITGNGAPSTLPEGVAFVKESRIYDQGFRYEDLVAASDVVVTKPGYGIISECIANQTAMLYTSRGHFPEYDVLVKEMPRYVRCAFIDQDSLLAGRWRDGLDGLLVAPPPPERPRTDGAEVAAEKIAEAIE